MFLRLEEFRRSAATNIVSVGEACANAYNLRRFYNIGEAYPFDWWVCEAQQTVAFLRDPDLGRLYNPELLELTEGRSSVRHKEYGILLHHEFPKEWVDGAARVVRDWQEHINAPLQRSTKLLNRFMAMNAPGRRIAFIINGKNSDELGAALANLFPNADWTLVHLDYIRVADEGEPWKGDQSAWDQVLEGLGLILHQSGENLKVELNPETERLNP